MSPGNGHGIEAAVPVACGQRHPVPAEGLHGVCGQILDFLPAELSHHPPPFGMSQISPSDFHCIAIDSGMTVRTFFLPAAGKMGESGATSLFIRNQIPGGFVGGLSNGGTPDPVAQDLFQT